MELRRVVASGVLGLTGVGLAAVCARRLLEASGGPAGVIVGGFGTVLGAGFVAGSYVLYHSELRTEHALRVAGWNLLGVVATASVLGVIGLYQDATGGVVTAPVFSAAVVVGVSATAHVLIGVNDVRRIRARTLADQRRKVDVVNRVVRHDLKHTAQILIGMGDRVASLSEDEELVSVGERVAEVGSDIGAIDDQVGAITDLVESPPEDRRPVDLGEMVADVRSDLDAAYPDADVSVDADETVRALAGDPLRIAFAELLENALEHGGDPATVEVRIEREGDTARVAVVDDGPGVPEPERSLILEEQAVTQLTHSSGLGLWLAKWTAEAYGGRIDFLDADGGAVAVELDAAP